MAIAIGVLVAPAHAKESTSAPQKSTVSLYSKDAVTNTDDSCITKKNSKADVSHMSRSLVRRSIVKRLPLNHVFSRQITSHWVSLGQITPKQLSLVDSVSFQHLDSSLNRALLSHYLSMIYS